MRMIDKVQAMNTDGFVDWLANEAIDEPWDKWFNEKYCKNCEPVWQYNSEWGHEAEYGWCELNGKCKFFQELNDVIDYKQIIKMWLELENGEDD